MQHEVLPFYYNSEDNKITTIRTIKDSDDKIWFVAKDVCDVLGLGNARQAISSLDDDEKNTVTINDGNRGNPNMNCVNESGLYTLIFQSRKPEARKFRKWVTNEVLPTLRKKGRYTINDELTEEANATNNISRGKMRAAKIILEAAGLTTGQELSMKLDKVYKYYTGDSILEITGLLDEWEAERLRECKCLSLPPEGWEPDCMNIPTF